MAAQRTAEAVWEGNLVDGSGTVSMASSGAFGEFPVTWAARAESPEGKTSPEELMAAAHAACYAIARLPVSNAVRGNVQINLTASVD